MAITQRLLNLDKYFRTTDGDKIIINDLNYFSINDKDHINKALMTVYDKTDVLSTKPSCDCQYLQGRYLIGKVCPQCSTECREPGDKIKPLLWLKVLKPGTKFLNPTFWAMLSNILGGKNVDYLRYLCDTRYNPRGLKEPTHIIGIRNLLNNVRNYENTINHIPNILNYLLNISEYKEHDKQMNVRMLLELYENYKQDIFSEYLPIINKKLFVVENTTKGRFINLASSGVVNVVMSWLKVCSEETLTDKQISNATASTVSNLAKLYETYYKTYLRKKHGIFRKNIYGTRSHFTFRFVIVSRPGKHRHDEIVAPWVAGVTAFRPHVLNKLVRRGYTYKEASAMLYRAVKEYNSVIHDILKELIAESPEKGIPILIQRNPSLKQGSSIRTRIVDFNPSPENLCIEFSQLIAKPPNADYDGDELNVTILLDNMMADEFKTLEAYYNIPDVSKPYSISGNLTLLSPATSTLSNYLSTDEDDNIDPKSDELVSKLNFIN